MKKHYYDLWSFRDRATNGDWAFVDLKKSGKLKISISRSLPDGNFDRGELYIPENEMAALLSVWKSINPQHGAIPASSPKPLQPTPAPPKKVKAYSIEDKRKEIGEGAYTPWTDADEKELASLYKQGWTAEQLAAKFKRSKNAIQSRIKKLGL